MRRLGDWSFGRYERWGEGTSAPTLGMYSTGHLHHPHAMLSGGPALHSGRPWTQEIEIGRLASAAPKRQEQRGEGREARRVRKWQSGPGGYARPTY